MLVRTPTPFQYTVSMNSLSTMMCMIRQNATPLTNQWPYVMPVESMAPDNPYE